MAPGQPAARAVQPDRAPSPIVDICLRPAAGSARRKPPPISTPRRRCAIASSTKRMGARPRRTWRPAAPRFRPVRRDLRSSAGARPQPRRRSRDRRRHLSPDPARGRGAAAARFYSAAEYDIAPLVAYPGEILELGRSCVDAAYRARPAMQLLWSGIAAYVFHYDIALMFGCASLPGTDPDALATPLSYLYHHHLAPPALRAARACPSAMSTCAGCRRRPRPGARAGRPAAADQGLSAARRLCRRRRGDRRRSSTPPTSASWSRPTSSAEKYSRHYVRQSKDIKDHGPENVGDLRAS